MNKQFSYYMAMVITIAVLFFPVLAIGQSGYEEITISFEVPRMLTADMFVRYDGKTLYLPTTEVFNLLDISISLNADRTQFQGFIFHKNHQFELRPTEGTATVNKAAFTLARSEYYFENGELFLRIDQFKRLFGLDLTFDFSMLRVLLPLNEEFPAWQKLKRKQAREKLQKQTAALKDIRAVPRHRELFSGGVADWTLSSNPIGGGGHYLDLALGSMVMGGDLTLSGTGNTASGFQSDQFHYRWHYAFNENPFVSQTELGSVNSGGPLSRSLTGTLITNHPQNQRQYFQTIDLDGQLEPGWEVELYVDGRLMDFAEADQSGRYRFNVDVVYGSSDITLKMYGPNGEIRTEERHVRVPYTLVPKGSFEYTVAGGLDDISDSARYYAQSLAYYGMLNSVTVGVGSDIPIGSESDEAPLVSAEATVQVAGNIIANASFAPQYQMQFGANYAMPSFISANIAYTKYYANSFRNPANQLQGLSGSVSMPIKVGQRYLGLRYNASYDQFNGFRSLSMNYGLTGSFWRFFGNYLGRYKRSIYPSRSTHSIASQLMVSTDLFSWLRPQARLDYDHEANEISRYGIYLTRRIFKTGQISLSYERSPLYGSDMVMLNINFFNSIANFSTRAAYSGDRYSMNQMQRGSVRYDRAAGKIRFDRRNGIGYGSAVVRPFLDLNNDGLPSAGEEYLPGLKAKILGVGGRPVGRGNLYYYEGLRPYDSYTISVDATSLDNPLLKPAFENYKVSVNPNVVTSVDVPVVMAADISGVIERETSFGKVGIGGIKLKVLNISKDIVTEIVSFSNGQYYFLGLIPGSYRAYLDPEQLERYGYQAEPPSLDFEVLPSEAGSSVENINFVLVPKK